mgnify:CR=1 FL=1
MREPQRQICPWFWNGRAQARLDRVVHVRVGEDDVRVLPPSSSESFLSFGATTDAIEAPVAVPPVNETAFTSGWPVSGGPTFGPSPCTMFKTPGGSPAAFAIAREMERRHRRDLRRLGDHRVARRERGGDLPRQQVEREVPRRDAGDDAQRASQRVVERRRVGGVQLGACVEDRGREETEVARRRAEGRSTARARPASRCRCDSMRASSSISRSMPSAIASKHARALGGRRFATRRKRRLGRGDRAIDVHGVAVGDERVRRADGRIHVVEIRAGGRLDERRRR